ncbi:MAG: SPOR domain-containing protein [Myxococcota bacterium]|nr:SPOR domain-containing protein [Myxococcota bacterium]
MADLARNHPDRQIWITRSHLAALGFTTLFIAVLAFFVGLKVGQKQTDSVVIAAAPPLLPDPVKEDALEDLLRQVENSQPVASNDLSFPSALNTTEVPVAPMEPIASIPIPTRVAPSAPPIVPAPPATPPTTGWAVQISSFEDPLEAEDRITELGMLGLSAYRVTALVNGTNWHRVRVGGYTDREDAIEASEALSAEHDFEDLMIARAP